MVSVFEASKSSWAVSGQDGVIQTKYTLPTSTTTTKKNWAKTTTTIFRHWIPDSAGQGSLGDRKQSESHYWPSLLPKAHFQATEWGGKPRQSLVDFLRIWGDRAGNLGSLKQVEFTRQKRELYGGWGDMQRSAEGPALSLQRGTNPCIHTEAKERTTQKIEGK